MYVNLAVATIAGTATSDIPETEEPIIPKATRYHFDWREATKKSLLLRLWREVKYENNINTAKYPTITSITVSCDIYIIFVRQAKLILFPNMTLEKDSVRGEQPILSDENISLKKINILVW
jgi:hypothetical protein